MTKLEREKLSAVFKQIDEEMDELRALSSSQAELVMKVSFVMEKLSENQKRIIAVLRELVMAQRLSDHEKSLEELFEAIEKDQKYEM